MTDPSAPKSVKNTFASVPAPFLSPVCVSTTYFANFFFFSEVASKVTKGAASSSQLSWCQTVGSLPVSTLKFVTPTDSNRQAQRSPAAVSIFTTQPVTSPTFASSRKKTSSFPRAKLFGEFSKTAKSVAVASPFNSPTILTVTVESVPANRVSEVRTWTSYLANILTDPPSSLRMETGPAPLLIHSL